jgi:signal transduction histidine kinase
VRFTIADNGVGIPPDRLKRIFEAFFTTKEMVGTGLGLWVSKQILEECGATIRVRSKLGSGTVISIVFPPGQEETRA